MTPYISRYSVRSYECGPKAEVAVPRILDYMQETASEHARVLGIDMPVIDGETGRRGAWVLAHLRLDVERLPKWRETVVVETFPHTVRALSADRDFRIRLDDGTPCAAASTRWMVIDPEARRAVRIPAGAGALESGLTPVFGGATDPFMSLRPPAEGAGAGEPSVRPFRVMRAHIDLNGHVNNAHYAAWMLESVPGETVAAKRLARLDIVFRSETLYGETVESVSLETAPGEFFHRVRAPGGGDHILAATRWV
ncbi:MAG: acyl-ACP thioesterase [Kiritimatiellae bacterium]|nr:acyl-ACP thioesterase [Kiritimatiellia bacterium]